MTLAVGTVSLGGIQLTADPTGFPVAWPPRREVFSGPGNWSQAQSAGVAVGDMELTLSGGETGMLDTATVQQLLALMRVESTCAYVDSFGNELTVLILDFQPQHRVTGLWDYTLRLSVRAATKILGVAEA